MPYIKTIEHEEATGRLKEIYDDLLAKRGKLADVHKIQSLNPESIVAHMNLYMTVMFGQSPLSREQREMIAVIVSVANDCKYCQMHHSEALNKYWKDEERVNILRRNFNKVNLNQANELFCELAWQLSRIPTVSTETILNKLKNLGIDDRSILDATLVIAYFNFVNRIVLGLGVEYESSESKGYKY
ncbi:MAG: peroxidase-related enzyme [Bacteroidia bacterium]